MPAPAVRPITRPVMLTGVAIVASLGGLFAWVIEQPNGLSAETQAAAGSTATPTQATPTPVPKPIANDDEGAITPPSAPAAEPAPLPDHEGRFTLPLAYWDAVTDRFGAPRGTDQIHGGIDLALDTHPASPVLAACPGTVTTAATSSTYGNYLMVDCGDGWSTLYGHLSRLGVTVGQSVTAGQPIGISGTTGYSTGEHLHFEIRYGGVPLNPESYLDFHIPPGTPLSNGPLVFGTPEPTETAPAATATEAALAATTPAGETTAAATTLPRTTFRDSTLSGQPAVDDVADVLDSDSSGSPGAITLRLNRLSGDSRDAALSTRANAEASCDAGCARFAVAVQVNLVPMSWHGERGAKATAVATDCVSCEATAIAIQYTIPVADPAAALSRPVAELLRAFTATMELLDAGTISPATASAQLDGIVEGFVDLKQYVERDVRIAGTPAATATPSATSTATTTAEPTELRPTATSAAAETPTPATTPTQSAAMETPATGAPVIVPASAVTGTASAAATGTATPSASAEATGTPMPAATASSTTSPTASPVPVP